jgi:hypothetical protein
LTDLTSSSRSSTLAIEQNTPEFPSIQDKLWR